MQRPGSEGDTRRGHLGTIAPLLWTSHGQTELFGPFLHAKFDTEAAGKQFWTKGCTGTTSLPSPTSPVPTLAFLLAKFPKFPAGNDDLVSLPTGQRRESHPKPFQNSLPRPLEFQLIFAQTIFGFNNCHKPGGFECPQEEPEPRDRTV